MDKDLNLGQSSGFAPLVRHFGKVPSAISKSREKLSSFLLHGDVGQLVVIVHSGVAKQLGVPRCPLIVDDV